MRVAIVGAPLALGQNKPGVSLAPNSLRQVGLVESIQNLGHEVADIGDLNFPPLLPSANKETYVHSNNNGKVATATRIELKNAQQVGESCHKIAQAVEKQARQGDFCLTIGGDHSIAAGTLPGIMAAHPDSAVIWVDAHGDFNTTETTPSGHIHGMPLAIALGLNRHQIEGFEWLDTDGTNYLPHERVALVGIRSLDTGERELLKKFGIKVYTMRDIDREGIGAVMAKALQAVDPNGNRPLHISFDVDSIDPSEAPGTGTRVKGGLSYREAHAIMDMASATGKLSSLDIAELNPELDTPDQQTSKLSVELILAALGQTLF